MIQSIFLLEDDDDDRILFTDALKTIGAHTHFISVSNGIEALKYLSTALVPPDIIFSDINMPIMNGFEFIKEINALESYKKVPIVLLSTLDVSLYPNIGDYAHVHIYNKPPSFRELCHVIEDILRKHGLMKRSEGKE